METRKQAIMAALDTFVRQRPGLDFRNYGDGPSYRAEARSITRDLKDYRVLERAVILADGIGADELIAAASSAYSGRLTILQHPDKPSFFGIDYCTGQYWPTEYRRAACAVLSAAIWAYAREHGMPAPTFAETGDRLFAGLSGGTWLRRHFYRTFGRAIAVRWFDWEPRDGT